MLKIGTIEDAVSGGRRRAFGEGNFKGFTDFMFESAPGEPLGPQAFLVHQAPNWTLPVHFHMQFQIQVVVGGGGTLGRHKLAPVSVHYASPQAAYGPLIAGDEGLEYFTLRVLTDKGAWYMPQSRPMMKPGIFKEQATGEMHSGAADVGERTILALRDDGLGAWGYAVAPGTSVECGQPASEAGRFHIVAAGSFKLDGQILPRHSCVFWAPPEKPLAFEAVDEGSELVVVQFPEPALHNVVPPELRSAPQQASATVRA